MIVELKYDKSSDGALAQIKEKNYPQIVRQLADDILLVGVNYDVNGKKHECKIEMWSKV